MVGERWHRIKLRVRYQEGGSPRPPDPESDAEKMWQEQSIQVSCGGESSTRGELGMGGGEWSRTALNTSS
jgi:hypothetical protein